MKLTVRVLSILAVAYPAVSFGDDPQANEPRPPFELRDGDRVVFLGNTLVERMARYGYVETALTARWPDRNVTFRNLGWSGDTVWAESRGLFDPPAKGYERMLKHVGELKPTVIFLGYGNVEAFAGEQGLPAFVKQYEKLLDDLTKVSPEGVRFVIVSPIPMESVAPPGVDVDDYNESVRTFGSAVSQLSARRGVRFVDLGPWIESVNRFHASGDNVHAVTNDGRQLSEFGNRSVARMLASSLGLYEGADIQIVQIDRSGKVGLEHRLKVERILSDDRRATLAIRPERLTDGIEFRWEGAENLSVRSSGEAPSEDWSASFENTRSIGIRCDDYEALRRAIVEKNRLYFLKWRPQNVTYLTLFRKHEQGNNAAELAEFDELVAEKEAEIAKLRKPVKRTYELIRVEPEKQKDETGE